MPKILDSRFHGFNSGTEVFTMELEYWIFRQAEDELERRKLILEEKKYRWFHRTMILITVVSILWIFLIMVVSILWIFLITVVSILWIWLRLSGSKHSLEDCWTLSLRCSLCEKKVLFISVFRKMSTLPAPETLYQRSNRCRSKSGVVKVGLKWEPDGQQGAMLTISVISAR